MQEKGREDMEAWMKNKKERDSWNEKELVEARCTPQSRPGCLVASSNQTWCHRQLNLDLKGGGECCRGVSFHCQGLHWVSWSKRERKGKSLVEPAEGGVIHRHHDQTDVLGMKKFERIDIFLRFTYICGGDNREFAVEGAVSSCSL